MVSLTSLWLPILLSAVFVFIASSIIHMLLPIHRNDFRKLPNEDGVMAALRPLAIPPGEYMFPRAKDMKDMKTPEFVAKWKQGPVAMMTVMPNGEAGMGKSLALWFVYCLILSGFAAYVAGAALGQGADYRAVFRFAGTTAFLGYAGALWQSSIWYKRPWTTTLKISVDGLVYGLVTGGVFGWLWP